ncbi:acyl carrier protein [Actinokineospora sp. NBRC 105648]|uniref:acyl carrier protein n=1 Tax=Actinokineospora sp. NBRC 105648 TaxID=3032206 RepID=UPI00249FD96F|nr:acyl carrier protein [Actinokineospora sp. NBRC 105648]GLZ39701.1 hypothetical protein Acsp05_33250 [Actinokineospora sp. NBRC 105648]
MSEDELLLAVRAAWADVLDEDSAEAVPLDTNFLEAGGNSLLLVMLWEQLHEATGQVVKMSDLFAHATVRAQAALLGGGATPEPAETGATERGRLLGRSRRASAVAGAE